MSPLFAKLNLKSEREILVLEAPASFEPVLATLAGVQVLRSLGEPATGDSGLHFAIAFVKRQAELDAWARALPPLLQEDAILWFAYPKQSSKRYQCEFHRDTGWGLLESAGYEKVRMVAIDEDWSALRFRKSAFVRSTPRRSTPPEA